MEGPLAYLMHQLKMTVQEWKTLPEKDKEDLKNWATEEQVAIEMGK